MIEIKNLTKRFDEKVALNNISLQIEDGSIFGLVGSNGAGKSTLLRIISGVYKADEGCVNLNKKSSFNDVKIKEEIAFVSDYPYFFDGYSLDKMAKYYSKVYSNWNEEKYNYYKSIFPIDSKQKISSMSKGMQRQVSIILALSHEPKCVLFDEIFDGIDPVIRELVKKILIGFVAQSKASIIIASHNLRELEGFCDHVGFLHKGGLLLEQDINSSSFGLYHVQLIPKCEDDINLIKEKLCVTRENHQGKMVEFTIKGEDEKIENIINSLEPIFFETLPLTLEELFIAEMEEAGYDIDKILEQ